MTPPPASFGANLALRIATAAIALPALAAAFFLGPPSLGAAVVGAAVLMGLWEYFELLRVRQIAPHRGGAVLLASAAFLDLARPAVAGAPLWIAGLLLVLVLTLPRADVAIAFPAAAATVLGAAYLGGLGGTMAALRTHEPSDQGPWRIAMLLAIVMVADTFAFFVGHAIGCHKLAPTVSPGKTVEGGVGSLLGGIVGALAVRRIGLPGMPLADAVALGLAVAAFGVAGDLFESLLKRWAGVKDSGGLFPGHGGMLDRLDSLLFGAPVLYYYFVFYAR